MADMPSKGPRLTLAKPAVSSRTIDALEDMLEAARRGELVGLAVVVMLRGNRFFVDAFGRAEDDPVFARGALRSLDDDLSARIADMKDSDTTLQPADA